MNIFGGREARNLTAEIDRETDAAVLAEPEAIEKTVDVDVLAEKARAEAAKTEVAETEQAGWQAGEVSEEMRGLGSAALEQAVLQSNEAIKEQVAVENGYVDTGLEPGKNVIGGASEKQIKERMAGDLEIAKMEAGVDLSPEMQWQAKILADSQGNLTKEAVSAVDQIVRQRDVKPWQIERQVHMMRAKMMETIGRTERN